MHTPFWESEPCTYFPYSKVSRKSIATVSSELGLGLQLVRNATVGSPLLRIPYVSARVLQTRMKLYGIVTAQSREQGEGLPTGISSF